MNRRFAAAVFSGGARIPIPRRGGRVAGAGAGAGAGAVIPVAVPAQPSAFEPTGEPVALDPVEVDYEVELPAAMAQIIVFPAGGGSGPGIGLRGVCCPACGPMTQFPQCAVPEIALGPLVVKGGKPPAEVLALMRSWSVRTMTELNRWIDARRAVHGDSLRLVVWDDSGHNLPWELLWLKPRPGSGRVEGWLGGLIPVTRWLTIRSVWPVTRDFRKAYECTGDVIAYIDETMAHDGELLTRYTPKLSETMRHLAGSLEAADAGALALVYVACHGLPDEAKADARLGDLPLLHFDSMTLARLRDAATFVFLNACYSGLLFRGDKRLKDEALRGFAEVFLRAGAAGVLATSGRISDDRAHEAARQLLEQLCRERRRPVAELLRDARAAFARRVPELEAIDTEAANRELAKLLYSFMYVYYGSPYTVLAPTGRKEGGDE